MRKILCNIGHNKQTTKPKITDCLTASKLQKETSKPSLIALDDFAKKLGDGYSFRPAAIRGTKNEQWEQQALFALDFDNTKQIVKPADAITKAKKNNLFPAIVYETFSSQEGKKPVRFRMLFVASRTITDLNERNKIQEYLMGFFGAGVVDQACKDEARIFYGTNKGILYHDYKAEIDVDSILSNVRRETGEKGHIKQNTSPNNKVSDNVKAIQRQDTEYLKKKLNKKKIVFDTEDEFFNHLYRKISLAELLEVEEKKNFSCVLPTHNGQDKKPSASVFVSDKGRTWRYKCFAEHEKGVSLNIKQVIEAVGGFESAHKALEFIKTIYNLSVKKTSWQVEQENNLNDITRYLSGACENSFQDVCPTAAKNTRKYIDLFRIIIDIARDNIYPNYRTEDGRMIFTMSIRQLARAAEKSSIGVVNNQINLLVYHGMIDKIEDNKVPKRLIKKILEAKKGKMNHIQFYSISSWVIKQLEYIEKQGVKWKNNGYRIGGISYEMFLRAEGIETAGRIYPQICKVKNENGVVVDRTTSKKSDELHGIIEDIMLEMITKNGYATEKNIIETIKKAGIKGKTITGIQIKRSLADIMNCNLLVKCRANKVLKEKYNIESRGYPAIIIKCKDN